MSPGGGRAAAPRHAGGGGAWLVVVAAAAAVAIALAADAVLAAPLFFSNDGFHHIFSAWGRAHLDDPALGYARYFHGNLPPSANGVADLFAWLAPAVGWRLAHQLTVVVIAAVWIAGSVALAASVHPRRALVGLVAGACALGFNLYLGFFEFALATGIGFFALALAIRSPVAPPATSRRVVVAALLLGASFVHFLAAALTGFTVAVVWLARVERGAGPRAWLRELVAVAAVGLPAAIPAVLAAGAVGGLPDVDESAPLAVRLGALGMCTVGGPWWRQLPVFAAAGAAGVALVVTRRDRGRVEIALGALAAAFAVVPWVVPWSVFGWQNVASRPLPLAVALFAALLPVERLPRAGRAVAAAAACAFFAAATLWARALDVEVARESADVLRVLARAPPNTGYRWPFILTALPAVERAGMVRWDPQRGLGSLFALVQGGFVAYAHVVSPQAHTLLLKPEVKEALPPPPLRSRWVTPLRADDDPVERRRALAVLMSQAMQVDGVIVIERPADHPQWKARGFTVDLEDGRVLLARFTGCSLTVDSAAPRDVSIAMAPESPALLRRVAHVDGPTRVDRVPCGAVTVAGCGSAVLSPDAAPLVRCGPGS